MKRKSKAEIERERVELERKRREKEQLQDEKERLRKANEIRKRREAALKAELRKEQTRPRTELPSAYAGESIYVHKRILDGFMKLAGKKLEITKYKTVDGAGGKLIIEYTTRHGGRGTLELNDLGPMPTH
jgi:Na+-translocating ferredoxin:NAD+ oxidoreductase RnfC subunit